jgi:molybdopterin molybdotransferase
MALLPIDKAIARLLRDLKPTEPERVDGVAAIGRTLAHPVSSPTAHPRSDNSAMDGYALRSCDGMRPRRLLDGAAAAGDPFDLHVGPDEAVRIFTGGQVPDGADAVVIQENVSLAGDVLTFEGQLAAYQHVRRTGSDTHRGQVIFSRGRRLNPLDIGCLSGLGISKVWVRRAPRLIVLATGDELVAPGEPAAAHQVYESNGITLAALAQAAGAKVSPPQRLPDCPKSLASALREAAKSHDLVLFAGGASVGDRDYVPSILREAGGEPTFYKVRMKPGKPVMATQVGDCQVLALPGNPVSAVTAHQVFVAPLIRTLCGDPRPFIRLRVKHLKSEARAGRRTLLLRGTESAGRIDLKKRQGSGDLSSLAEVDGFALLPADGRHYNPGDRIAWWPLEGTPSSMPPEAQLRALGLC